MDSSRKPTFELRAAERWKAEETPGRKPYSSEKFAPLQNQPLKAEKAFSEARSLPQDYEERKNSDVFEQIEQQAELPKVGAFI